MLMSSLALNRKADWREMYYYFSKWLDLFHLAYDKTTVNEGETWDTNFWSVGFFVVFFEESNTLILTYSTSAQASTTHICKNLLSLMQFTQEANLTDWEHSCFELSHHMRPDNSSHLMRNNLSYHCMQVLAVLDCLTETRFAVSGDT